MIWTGSGATPSGTNSTPERPGGPVGLLRASHHLARSVGYTLLAPECLVCETPLTEAADGPVCSSCWSRLQLGQTPQCAVCGAPVAPTPPSERPARCGRCLDTRTPIARLHACGAYDGVLRSLIHELKYGRHVSLAPRLAALARTTGYEVLNGADGLVPVPLHPVRRLFRGFNQASLIAQHLDMPVILALRRTRWTASQTRLSAAGRQRNMRQAFRVRWRVRRHGARGVRGRILVLVDDVRTTGATLEACASALLEAGAAEVRALVVARAAPLPRRVPAPR